MVLDTNLFVAAYWNRVSASAEVLRACLEGRLRLFYTDRIRREVSLILRNIRARDDYRRYVDEVLAAGTEVSAPGHLSVVEDDPDDDKFLECAVAARADYLVSSDSHLICIGQFEGTRIIKPSEMRRVLSS